MASLLRVLLIEDSESDALLLLRALRHGGYEVLSSRVETADGLHAALEQQRWDIIISDHNMPAFSAPAALAVLQQKNIDLPFIIVSGTIGEDLAVAAMRAGAHDYLRKDNLSRLVPAVAREVREAEHRRCRRETEQRYRTLVEASPDGIVLTDAEDTILMANQCMVTMLGFTSADELRGTKALDLLVPEERPRARAAAAQHLAGIKRAEYTVLARDGTTRPVEVSTAIVSTDRDTPLTFISIVRDVTERKRIEAELRHLALHDPLTDLPNRTLLRDRVEQAIRMAQRDGTSLALLLLDLDRFKEVNDTAGHHHGDLLLQQVALRLRTALRVADTVARLGGDEFAVLLPGTDQHGAITTAEKLSAALGVPFVLDGQPVHLGSSIGICLYPAHGTDMPALLRHADVAMYAAKRRGETWALYDAAHDPYTRDHLAFLADLRRAVEMGAFVLHYQPKVNLARGSCAGVEALVRWVHPQRGLVAPEQFIPLAEQTGLITPLTWWVLEQALCQVQRWQQEGLDASVAVNLAMATLHDPLLPDTVRRLLQIYSIPPSSLRIEVTEGGLMADVERTQEVLRRLALLGVGLSVDDYGTGYASLAYLKQLPVDELKIDRSFVRQMRADEADASIVASTIGLGHRLGLQVIAEGVEDEETWTMLAEMECDAAQGYYFSRPLPAPDLECWLREHAP